MMSLRYYKVWWLLSTLAIVSSTYLALMPSPPGSLDVSYGDKVQHVVGFFMLYCWFMQLLQRALHRRLVISLLLYGVLIEVLQGLTGYRAMEAADVLADLSGILLGWWLGSTRLSLLVKNFETGLLGEGGKA